MQLLDRVQLQRINRSDHRPCRVPLTISTTTTRGGSAASNKLHILHPLSLCACLRRKAVALPQNVPFARVNSLGMVFPSPLALLQRPHPVQCSVASQALIVWCCKQYNYFEGGTPCVQLRAITAKRHGEEKTASVLHLTCDQ